MIVYALTGTDGIVVLPGVVDSNSFIKLSFPFCGSDILHTYVYLHKRQQYNNRKSNNQKNLNTK
jgi:hypothetical protein